MSSEDIAMFNAFAASDFFSPCYTVYRAAGAELLSLLLKMKGWLFFKVFCACLLLTGAVSVDVFLFPLSL